MTVLNAGGPKSRRNICTLRIAGGLMNELDAGCHRWIGGGSRVDCGAGWIGGLVFSSLRADWMDESLLVPPTGFEQFVTDSVTG